MSVAAQDPWPVLLSVKKLHEENASKTLRTAKVMTKQKDQARLQRHKELLQFQQWRVLREREILDEIFSGTHKRDQLMQKRDKIFRLKEKENQYLRRLQEAEQELEQARQNQKKARKEYLLRQKATQKFTEILKLRETAQQREKERKEESEIEEFAIRNTAI